MRNDYLFVGITLAIAIISVFCAVLVFLTAKRQKGIWQIGFLFLLEFIYAIGYAFEGAAESLPAKMAFNHVQYIALPFIAVTWLYIAKKFQNFSFKPKLWKALPFVIIPVAVFITAELSYFTSIDLYYTNEIIDYTFKLGNVVFPVLSLDKGVFYYLNSASNLLLTGYVLIVYLKIYFHTTGMQRKQSMALAISSFLGMIAITITFFSSVSTGIDLAFYLVVITGYVIVFAMIKYEIIDIKPSAHKATFELTSDPIIALDDKLDIIDWNNSAEQFFLNSGPIKYHQSFEDLIQNSDIYESIKSHIPYSLKTTEKHFIIETVELQPKIRTNSGYLIRFNDMTSYMERVENLQHDATHDVLTQILNRRAFIDLLSLYLETIKNKGENFSIFMIDIDDFKNVNDTYGHAAGDAVLHNFSQIINNMIPEESVFARYGGEEFTILLKGKDEIESSKYGESVKKKINSSIFKYQGSEIKINISIGISIHLNGGKNTVSECIKFADNALCQSKRTGKNKITIARVIDQTP